MLSKSFIEQSEIKAFDASHRKKINFNIGRYDKAVTLGKAYYQNLELAKSRAHYVKWKAIEHLDTHLEEFERVFTAKGGKVIWANDANDAMMSILKIVEEKGAKTVVKSKSMVTEEIHLNKGLEKHGVEVFETDLGEFIVQLAEEPPYHIITPAMHKSKEDIAQLFNEKFDTPLDYTPEQLTNHARTLLRNRYHEAEIGVTGANFIVAKEGAILVTENEGNARLCVGFPKIHIAIVGIEKVIPSMKDLDLFLPLLATHGTGQLLTVYNTLISGPKAANENSGPEEMYVILLDNGRTELLAKPEKRQALYCIRCGACLNACPVYKNIGGHTYNTTYSGPIGAVITPHLQGMKEYKHLSFASSLCGNCTEVCPVKINLHNLLLLNRKESVTQGLSPSSEAYTWFLWKQGMLNRKLMNVGTFKLKNWVMTRMFSKAWGDRRHFPDLAKQSFNQQWRLKTNTRK